MKKKRLFLIPLCLLLLAAAWFLLRSRIPQRWYTADELGIPQLQSPLDADGDGVDDWTDMVLGARAYIGTHPHYKSKYYAGGYPDDGLGVCTDVIWQAFRAAGYSLKDLVDRDIADHTGLDALGQPRAAQGGTAQLFHILGTELAAHIFGRVFERVDIHGVLLLA